MSNNQHTSHSHSHSISLNGVFIIGIALNIAFVVIEFLMGIFSDSVGLISDAGHNLSDVVSLVLAMLAFRLSKIHATKKHTYGYKKESGFFHRARAL
jgi:cobalt-zinc-cadmium efflux system protein